MQFDRSYQLLELCVREGGRAQLLGLHRSSDGSQEGDKPDEPAQAITASRCHDSTQLHSYGSRVPIVSQ